jgi:phospholipid transport system substrate-binding protein
MLRLALIALLVPALAAAGPATDAVKKANDTISDLLKKQAPAAQVTTSVNNFIDIDELGKRAMGDHWDKLKPDEKAAFLKKLHQLIEANYSQGMQANLNYTVAYTGENSDTNGNTTVTTVITAKKKGRPVDIHVDYVLTKQGASYRAYDVKTDDVGLVDNYRQQFDSIITKKGFQDLLDKMDKKIADINAKNSSGGSSTSTGSTGGGTAVGTK